MAAVTIHSDFGAPNIKSVTVSVSFYMLALPRLPKVLLVLPPQLLSGMCMQYLNNSFIFLFWLLSSLHHVTSELLYAKCIFYYIWGNYNWGNCLLWWYLWAGALDWVSHEVWGSKTQADMTRTSELRHSIRLAPRRMMVSWSMRENTVLRVVNLNTYMVCPAAD